ncbi:MAG: nuclear transport factor 2 family protein [Ginsengibacter sp.]
MAQINQHIIKKAYEAFNKRNIDEVISLMHPDVNWPNGWEGGILKGHNEVRNYWERQWKELNPHVMPISLKEPNNGRIRVEVHQVVKDMGGNLLMDEIVIHTYTFENRLIKSMEIEKP